MFNFFKQWSNGKKATNDQLQTATFKLSGLHCSSCGLTIDNALEDLVGVREASTSYAKGEVRVLFDPKQVQSKQLKSAIQGAGYQVI